MICYFFHIQNNHPKYTVLLASIPEMPELYILAVCDLLVMLRRK